MGIDNLEFDYLGHSLGNYKESKFGVMYQAKVGKIINFKCCWLKFNLIKKNSGRQTENSERGGGLENTRFFQETPVTCFFNNTIVKPLLAAILFFKFSLHKEVLKPSIRSGHCFFLTCVLN